MKLLLGLFFALTTVHACDPGYITVDADKEIGGDATICLKLENNVTLTIKMTRSGTEFFAVALSKDTQMTSGDIAFVYEGGASPQGYAQALGTTAAGSKVTDSQSTITTSYTNGVATLNVVIPDINAYMLFNFPDMDAAMTFLYAKGVGATYGYHQADKGWTEGLTLQGIADGTAVATSGSVKPTSTQWAHGICMLLAWGMLCPTAVLAAANKKNIQFCGGKPPLWWQLHQYCNTGAIVLTLVAFFIAISMTNVDHFSFSHAKVGLVIVIFACCQPVIAYFRPHPPEGGWPMDGKPWPRIAFEVAHISIGLFCLFGGIANCSSGMGILKDTYGGDTEGWQMFLYIWLGLMCAAWVMSTGFGRFINADPPKAVE